MRANKYIATVTGISRRKADNLLKNGGVFVNGRVAKVGQTITESDQVYVQGKLLEAPPAKQTILLHKPVGYVCSRAEQNNHTIYRLLPEKYMNLKPVGRLDKESSGLLLLTNDGKLAQELTHPRFQKEKTYEIQLDKPLTEKDIHIITTTGVKIDDKHPSRFTLQPHAYNTDGKKWTVVIREGRNRQIRKTFSALGYTVVDLHRTALGPYKLGKLRQGSFRLVKENKADN